LITQGEEVNERRREEKVLLMISLVAMNELNIN
jgi:hypothetical protein